MTAQQAPRRERKKERTRQALLDVAIQLIAERGIYGTRVEDITEKTDLGKGAFYNYFESKDRLLAELVSQGVDVLHARYLSELDPAAAPAERIARVIAAHEAFFTDHPAYEVLFQQARGLAKVPAAEHAALASVFVAYLERTALAVCGPAERGGIGEAERLDLAAVVLGAIAGYRSFRQTAGLPARSRAVADVLASGVPSALAARMRTR